MPHVCQRLELPTRLIEVASRPQVGLGASDSTSRHVDAPAHLNALLVPQVEEHGGVLRLEVDVFIVLLAKGKHLVSTSYLELTLGEVQHLEDDDVVLVQEVEPSLLPVHFDQRYKLRNLYVVEEVFERLQTHDFWIMQEDNHVLKDPGAPEFEGGRVGVGYLMVGHRLVFSQLCR